MPFTHEEKCDMVETFIICRKNSIRAFEYYRENFPNRNTPDRRYFLILYRKFRGNENLFTKKRTRKRFIISEDVETNVLAYFEAFPNNSLRDLAKDNNLSLTVIHKILRKHKFIPYKYCSVQTLVPGDADRRGIFCRWLVASCRENPNFLRNIIWSDESNFSNSGMFNRKNMHYWSRENPLLAYPSHPQTRFSLSVWCGLIGSKVVGPLFYHGTLTGARYVNFMVEVLEEYLDDVNLEDRQTIYFQQDGAPAHNFRDVVAMMQRLFEDRWMGTNGPINWPPRSPDLSPLDFFFWGLIKNQVYQRKYGNVGELEDSIRLAINSIDGRSIRNATKSVYKRALMCIQENGGVFEHLL